MIIGIFSMKKTTLIIFLAVSLIFSCKEEIGNLSDLKDVKKIFPVTENYWFKYLYLILDKSGKHFEDSNTVILMKVVSTETLLNKKSYVFHIIDTLGQCLFIQKYSIENNKIYIYSNLINDLVSEVESYFSVNLPIKIGSKWLLMADPIKKEWITYLNNIDSDFINPKCRIVGKLWVAGNQGSVKYININDQTIPAKEYILVYQFKGYVKNEKNEIFKTNFAIKLHTWFGLNAGILESFVEPTYVDLHFLSFPYGGYKDKVIKFNIK
ncbi:hypothetical protein D9V86_03030 [Bacteroidetes/Chlorobi group bacterium ChocPot_Mid]|nr:MAG: hypothetical protein D9V86_03030 [Bacteroidetes/Chlorobi group bacterium ChocPot_Mid]